jgi:hypothetical protein
MNSVKKVRKLDAPPEILYESPSYPGEKVSPIPYVIIPKDKDMPVGLFIMRYSQTGEFEVGDTGKPEEIMDGPHPHMFIDFKHLEEVLCETFPSLHIGDAIDKIRVGLGMKPLDKARKDGNELIDRVVAKANDIAATAFENQQERKAEYENKLKKDMKEDQSK